MKLVIITRICSAQTSSCLQPGRLATSREAMSPYPRPPLLPTTARWSLPVREPCLRPSVMTARAPQTPIQERPKPACRQSPLVVVQRRRLQSVCLRKRSNGSGANRKGCGRPEPQGLLVISTAHRTPTKDSFQPSRHSLASCDQSRGPALSSRTPTGEPSSV